MRREVSISVFAVLIIAAAILTVYYLNVGLTGFAVSNTVAGQSTIFSLDASSILNGTLYPNGQYIFSTNNTGEWVNDTSANFTETSSWANVTKTLNSTTGIAVGYTWYLTNNESSSISTEVFVLTTTTAPIPPLAISISAPAGQDYTSLSAIPLTFTITGGTGTNLTCLYNINYAGSVLVSNTSISCGNGTNTNTFDLPKKGGDNILTLYASDTSGSASASSPVFQVSLPAGGTITGETVQEETPVSNVTIIPVTQISLGEVPGQDIIQGDSRQLTLSVQNTGNVPLTSCTLTGDDSGLVTITDVAKNINAGEGASFSFSVSVPEETSSGAHTLGLSVDCAETSASREVAVNVLQKKLDFNITNVQRTREDRVRVDYIITELAGEDQELEIFFSIKDASGVEVGNVSQNRSIDANGTDDFRTNIQINETLLPVNETTGEPIETDLTLSASFNSQIYSSSVREPISLGSVTGGAIFGGEGGAGSIVLLIVVAAALGAVFFVVRKLRKS